MDKKEFIIVINGVKEAISEVDELSLKLSSLQDRLDKLSNASISIKVEGELPTASAPEEPPTATTVEMERQLEVAKELNQVRKQIAQGARDENGEYTNTLKGLRAQLSEMKKQLSLTELGTEAFDKMQASVAELNEEVKNIEKSYGDFQRSVGNYATAAEGFNKLSVNIGGVTKEFDNLRSANKELSNELNSIALRMQELQNSGQGTSDEFKALSQRFEDVAKASESLDKANEYAERMKTTIQDDSGAIGELARSFEAFNSIAQIGVGVLGLFGDENKELQENINRTIQVTTILKGIQELYNTQLQKGAPIMKAYSAAVNLVEGALYKKAAAQTADNVATNAGTVATHTFSKALVATGIGAIVVALGLLVANFSSLTEWIGEATKSTTKFGAFIAKTKEVIVGVGNAVVQYITTPIRTAIAVIKKIAEGDFKGAVQAFKTETKKGFDFVNNYQKASNEQAIKNEEDKNRQIVKDNEKKVKEQAKQEAEATKHQIEENEARYGSDWKYSEDAKDLYDKMFADRMTMYDQDSDEYRKAQNEKLSYDREYEEKQKERKRKANEEAQKRADEHNKKLKEIEEKLFKDELELIDNQFEKRRKELERQRKKELEDAKASGIKVKEQEKAINEKFDKQIADNEKKSLQEQYKVREDYNKKISKLTSSTASIQIKNIDVKSGVERWRKDLQSQITKGFIEPLDKDMGDGITDVFDRINSNLTKNLEKISNNAQSIKALNNEIFNSKESSIDIEVRLDVSNALNQMGENINEFLSTNDEVISKSTNESLKKVKDGLEEMRESASKTTYENVFTQLDKLESVYKTLSATIDDFLKNGGEGSEELIQMLSNLNQNIGSQLSQNVEVFTSTNQRFLDESRNAVEEHNKTVVDSFSEAYEQLMDVSENALQTNGLGNNNAFGDIAEIIKRQKAISKLSDSYKIFTDKINEQISIAKNENSINKEKIKHYETEKSILSEYITVRENIDKLESKPRSEWTEEETKSYDELNKKATEFEVTLTKIDKDQNDFNRSVSVNQLKGYSKQFEDSTKSIESTIDENNKYISSLSKLADNITKFQDGSKVTWKDWANSIADSLDFVGNSASSIISNIADAMYNNATAGIEKMMDELDKESEAYQEKYDKETEALEESLREQEELIAEHNNIINGLEGELSTARGDRRLEVLDAITSEKAAREKDIAKQKQLEKQREVLEKQKSEFDKQQEEKKQALQAKMDEEEIKRKKLQKIASITQATVNTAVGVTQALASGPPWISIPQAVIIGAMGAAEIAMIASQQYANGGLLIGNSHQSGGIKVLGGSAEVEGGEYITNKRTTKYNLPLLDYINSQNGRIGMEDLIEFFGKKNSVVNYSAKTVFASGGVLPQTLSNPNGFSQQRIIKTINQDNRPIVVSVEEIVDVAENMRNVRVLSGEEDIFQI